jgi:hypothetical protein
MRLESSATAFSASLFALRVRSTKTRKILFEAEPQKRFGSEGPSLGLPSCLFKVAAERLIPICLSLKTRQEALKSLITVGV